MNQRNRVLVVGTATRLFCLLLILGFKKGFKPYDTSSELNLHGECNSGAVSYRPHSGVLPDLVVWDSVYFMRIAKCGYEYEHSHAFFPGYPGVVAVVGRWLEVMVPESMRGQGALSLAGLMISNMSYLASIGLFYEVSVKVLGRGSLAVIASVLYSVPPSSVFVSVSYTEGLFALLTMAALWQIQCRESIWGSAVCIAGACAVRSNGVLHAGYIGHFALREMIKIWPNSKFRALGMLVKMMGAIGLAVSPLVYFQLEGYNRFCTGNMPSSWCKDMVPLMYGHIQKEYWGVGFLRYFEAKQIPNFLVASPTLAISFIGCFSFISMDWGRTLSLGLIPRGDYPSGFYNDRVAPFVYQWAFMSLYSFFVMYVQVSTRFLSASPPFYWYMAHLWRTTQSKLLWLWLLSFVGLGSLLFPNFYPWT